MRALGEAGARVPPRWLDALEGEAAWRAPSMPGRDLVDTLAALCRCGNELVFFHTFV